MGMMGNHTSDHVWPHWPAEVHYEGKGHGAYPFWAGGGGSGSSAAIDVYWSEKQLAERFYHASCSMTEVGYSSDTACYHLFVGGQPGPGGSEKLAPPQSDFMDKMTLTGTESFTGDFYTGSTKHYLMQLASSEAVDYFWYVTTDYGKPVEQGEGGKNRNDSSGKGIQIFHDYNTDTFESVTIDASIFEVPSICKTTSNTCTFP